MYAHFTSFSKSSCQQLVLATLAAVLLYSACIIKGAYADESIQSIPRPTLDKLHAQGRAFTLRTPTEQTSLSVVLNGEEVTLDLIPHDIRAPGYRSVFTGTDGTIADPYEVYLFKEKAGAKNFSRLAIIRHRDSGKEEIKGLIARNSSLYSISTSQHSGNESASVGGTVIDRR